MAARERKRARIVVADDDDNWRDLLAGALELAGYDVAQVSDGSALRSVLEAPERDFGAPDLVISDQVMPHATGLEVLAWARASAPEVPFILLSAVLSPHILRPALELGAAAVLPKPIELELLLSEVDQALSRKAVH